MCQKGLRFICNLGSCSVLAEKTENKQNFNSMKNFFKGCSHLISPNGGDHGPYFLNVLYEHPCPAVL